MNYFKKYFQLQLQAENKERTVYILCQCGDLPSPTSSRNTLSLPGDLDYKMAFLCPTNYYTW